MFTLSTPLTASVCKRGAKMALSEKKRDLIWEFIRYAIVGGIASVVDMGVFALVRELCFGGAGSNAAIAVGTAAGFAAGICINYILSMAVVFRTEEQQKQGRNRRAVMIFVAVGIVGFVLTMILQWLGESVLLAAFIEGDAGIWKYAVKIAVMGVVLIWNYLGRKIFVFGGTEK